MHSLSFGSRYRKPTKSVSSPRPELLSSPTFRATDDTEPFTRKPKADHANYVWIQILYSTVLVQIFVGHISQRFRHLLWPLSRLLKEERDRGHKPHRPMDAQVITIRVENMFLLHD